jgi:hypothetical protein
MKNFCLCAAVALATLCGPLHFAHAAEGQTLKVEFKTPLLIFSEIMPAIIAPLATVPPKIDGDLNDAGWQNAAVVKDFHSSDPADLVTPQATAFICSDKTNLYVAVQFEEPLPHLLKAAHTNANEDVFDDDSIELFIDAAGDRRNIITIAANTIGTRYDAALTNYSYNTDKLARDQMILRPNAETLTTQTKAAINGTKCIIEFSVPAAAITRRAEILDGETWRLGIRRNRAGAVWPQRTSACAFGASDSLVPTLRQVQMRTAPLTMEVHNSGAILWGKNEATVRVKNSGDAAQAVQVQALLNSDRATPAEPAHMEVAKAHLSPEQVTEFTLPYSITWKAGRSALRLRLTSADAKTDYAIVDFQRLAPAQLLSVTTPSAILFTGDAINADAQLALGGEELKDVKLLVTLQSPEGAKLAEWAGACAKERVRVSYPTDYLKPGDYTLDITLMSADGKPIAENAIIFHMNK